MRDSRAGRTLVTHRLRKRLIVLASIPAGLGWLLFGGTTAVGLGSVCDPSNAPALAVVHCFTVVAGDISATEGVTFSNKVVGGFADSTSGHDGSGYTATIDWGDGTAASTGTVTIVSNTTGVGGKTTGTVKGSHAYAEEGSHDLTVTVDHGASSAFDDTGSATVDDGAITVTAGGTATEGASTDAVVATFTDENPNAVASDFTALVNCNFVEITRANGRVAARSSVATPTIVKNGNLFEVHFCRFDEEGLFNAVQVTVTDKDGKASDTKNGNVVVSNAALTATKGADISTTENGPTGPYVVATFTDANGVPDAADFSAKIKWGDASSDSNGTVAENTGGPGFKVSGFHGYHEGGSFTVTVTITDQDGADASTATATLTATVTDAALHATNGAGATSTEGSSTGSLTLATFTDSSDAEEPDSTYSATVDWKDGSTSTCSSTSTTCSISFNDSTSKMEVKSSHTYAEEGTYVAHVTISDKGGATATADDTITVKDAALTASNGQAISVQRNQSTGDVVTATFTDANSNKDKADFTATIDWGDSKTSAGTVSVANGTFSVTGSHTYTGTGSFTVKTSITDTGSSTASATAAASVAAPPTLATTGAGWLIPPGASGYAFLGGLLLVLGVLGWWAVLRDRFVWSSKRLR